MGDNGNGEKDQLTMSELRPPEPTGGPSRRTVYALVGALAVAAFLVGVVGVLFVRGGSDEETTAVASGDAGGGTQTSVPANRSAIPSGERTGVSNEAVTPPAGATEEPPVPTATGAGGGGGAGPQGSASPTAALPTPAPSAQASPQPQQGASTATITTAPPIATKTPPQQATATPTRTPTKAAPTATKSATPTKVPPTATKSPTMTATATRTATPTPTATPPAQPIQTGQFDLFTGLDSTETLTNLGTYPTLFYYDRVDYWVTGLSEDENLPGGKARLVIQATCNPGTGSGLQHVRFRNSSASNTQLPCNRTVVDMIVTDDFIHGTVIVTTVGPAATVEWTLTATVLAIN